MLREKYSTKNYLKTKYDFLLIMLIFASCNLNSIPLLNVTNNSNSATLNKSEKPQTIIQPLSTTKGVRTLTQSKKQAHLLSAHSYANPVQSQATYTVQNLNSYTQIVSVIVSSNSDFNKTGSYFTGKGTQTNPYLLSGFDFAPTGFGAVAITISNTNAYFEVLNNTISVASSYFVELINVSNGLIVNNSILYSYNPIYITGNSSNISIINNTISGTPTEGTGIESNGNFGGITVFNNTVTNFQYYGILFQDGGKNNIIENNTVINNLEGGISIAASSSYSTEGTYNSTITNNILTNNYIYFETDYYYKSTPIYQFNVSNNFVNGEPVDFFQNTNNPTFSSHPSEIVVFNSANITISNLPFMSGPFIVSHCTNVMISNITIHNSISPGMDLYSDNNITVTDNFLLNDSIGGINLYSTNATVTHNTVSGRLVYSYITQTLTSSANGITLGAIAMSSIVTFNTVSNYGMGIVLSSDNDTVTNNIIRNVTANAISIGYINTTYSISNNQLYNYSLTLSNFFTSFIFTNNTFDDAPIVIYNGLQNQVIVPKTYGQIFIENSNNTILQHAKVLFDVAILSCINVTVTNTTILSNGLTVSSAGNVTVTNNTIFNLFPSSMALHISSTAPNTLIENNTLIGTTLGGSTGMFLTGLNSSLVKNNTIRDFSYGIELSGEVNSSIFNNTITFSESTAGGYAGIYVKDPQAQYNKVAFNTIHYFTYGIYLDYTITFNQFFNNTLTQNQYGIYVNQAHNNTIYDNFVTGGNGYGLYLNYAHYTTVLNNIFDSNYYGGYLYSSSVNNTISGNYFSNSTTFGLYVDSTSNNNTFMHNAFINNSQNGLIVYSVNNTITLNDFINNNQSTVLNPRIQVYVYAVTNNVTGNYYSDSHNYDFNWDGIVDTSYSNFGSSVVDRYPKANPINSPDTVSPTVFISPANNSIFDLKGFSLDYNISERSVTVIFINGLINGSALPSGTNMSYLGIGTFNITIKATDFAGNLGIASISVTIKASLLTVSIVSPSNTTYNSLSLNTSYLIQSLANYTAFVYLNGVNITNSFANNTFWTYLEGYNNLTLFALDTSGNTAFSSVFFTVDTTTPVLTIVSLTNTTYTNNNVFVNYTIFDYSSIKTTMYVNGKANTTSIAPGSTIMLITGYYNITFVVADIFNQTTIQSVYFSVDVRPTVAITSITNQTYTSTIFSINYTVSNANKVEIYMDGGNATTFASGLTIRFLKDGSHNITIVVTNFFNQKSRAMVIFNIDTIPPIVTITSPTARVNSTGSIMLTYQINESDSYTTKIIIDDVTNTTAIPNNSILQFTPGTHTITIVVKDTWGINGSASVSFYIPTLLTISSTTGSANLSNPTGSGSYSSSTVVQTTNSFRTTKTASVAIISVLFGFGMLIMYRFSRRKRKI